MLEGGAGVLDPTGPGGELCDPLPLLPLPLPLPAVDTTLARINEPGPGGDVNVDVEEQAGAGLTFVAGRDLRRREELFLDYGSNYNRTGYG